MQTCIIIHQAKDYNSATKTCTYLSLPSVYRTYTTVRSKSPSSSSAPEYTTLLSPLIHVTTSTAISWLSALPSLTVYTITSTSSFLLHQLLLAVPSRHLSPYRPQH